MTAKRISELPSLGSVAGTLVVPTSDGFTTSKMTVQQIKDSMDRLVNGSNQVVLGTDGIITLPFGSTINDTPNAPGSGNGKAVEIKPGGVSHSNQLLRIYATVPSPDANHLHLTSGDLSITDLFLGNDDQFVQIATDGKVCIGTYGTSGHFWQFGTDGALTLPLGGTVTETQFVSGGGLGGADLHGTLVLTPNGAYNPWNNLTIYNTAFNPETQHIHLTSGDLNLTEIVLGDDNKFVKVNIDGSVCVQSSRYYLYALAGTSGSGSTVISHTNLNNIVNVGDYIIDALGNEYQITGVTGTDPNWTISTNWASLTPALTSPYSFYKPTSTGGVWQFGTDGTLTLPTGGNIDTVSGTGGFKLTTDGQIQFASGYSIGGSDTQLGLRMATDRGTILFGNHPEIGTVTHFHIMKQDPVNVELFLGDDLNYVKLPGTQAMAYGVEIGANGGSGANTWRFGTDGTLTFPDLSVQTTAYTANTPPALVGLLSTATTIAITAATEDGGPSANIDVTITNHQVDHYNSTAYTGNILSTGLVVIPDTTQSPPIDHTILQVGSQSLTQSYNLGASGSPAHSHYIAYAYVVTPFGTVWSAPTSGTFGSVCLIAGTMITLSDGSHKAIEDITYTDKLQSWNFDQGCYAETRALWIKQAETGSQYNLLTFSDGTTLRTFDQHRIFNKEAGAFTYPMTDATPIGTTTVNEYGQEITLVDKQVIVDTINYYNVITDYHMNLFSDTVLTSCRFNNIYPITDMKFVKDTRTPRTRDEFVNIPDRFFYGLRLAEQTTDIETVEWYVNRLLSLEISTELASV